MVQYSKGPWMCHPNPYGRSDAEFCIYNERGNILSNSDEVNEANARLIAAAPDLLAALIEVDQWLQASGQAIPAGTFEVIQTAIKKATGVK